MRKIYFIHEGKANYPSIKGYKVLWDGVFDMDECSFEEALNKSDLADSICWHMMGFYSKKLPCTYTIHDYRSLSIGTGRRIKDFIKYIRNAKPDLRVIQPSILSELSFKDNIPHVLQDVGIADSIKDAIATKSSSGKYLYDFSYIGAMKTERKMELMIDSFLKHFGETNTLTLVGYPNASLVNRYKKYKQIIFTGLKTQQEVFEYIEKSKVSVCYFPNHYPHVVQTPTKLLEAAAMGARILANRQSMNEEKCDEYGINVHWGDTKDMFTNIPANLDWQNNNGINITPMLWSTIVEKSGIIRYLM